MRPPQRVQPIWPPLYRPCIRPIAMAASVLPPAHLRRYLPIRSRLSRPPLHPSTRHSTSRRFHSTFPSFRSVPRKFCNTPSRIGRQTVRALCQLAGTVSRQHVHDSTRPISSRDFRLTSHELEQTAFISRFGTGQGNDMNTKRLAAVLLALALLGASGLSAAASPSQPGHARWWQFHDGRRNEGWRHDGQRDDGQLSDDGTTPSRK